MNNFFYRYRGVIYASITALFWGFLSIALKVALSYMPSFNIVWFRFILAFTLMFIYIAITQPKKLTILKKPPILAILAAVGLSINYIAYIKGLNLTSPNTAQIIIQIGPILLGIIGFVIYKERINKFQMLGFAFAAGGLALFYFNQIEGLIEDNVNIFNQGFILVVFAALGWVLYAALQKHLLKSFEGHLLNLVIFAVPSILFLPFVDFSLFVKMETWQWVIMIFLGLNTIIAYGFLVLAFKYTQVNKVSVILSVNPIITFLAMTLLFYLEVSWIETSLMGFKAIAGGLLVILGAIFVIYFRKN